jgi:RNA polymerase sigma-70 factor, ECF subfamily
METPPTDSVDRWSFLTTARNGASARSSEIEQHVIALFEQFRSSLLRYVLAFGLSVQDGEEVAQEVFLALFRHMTMGKPRQNLRGWIFSVAHNLALKQRQANRRFRDRNGSAEMAAENRLDPSPNPEEQVLTQERRTRLLAFVHVLPEQDRCCLYLRAEGLRYREIAHVLGISLGAVSASLTRSLTRLMGAYDR